MGMWFREGKFYFYDTGELYSGHPKTIILGDPTLFFADDGRQIIPASEWRGETMSLKVTLPVTVAEAQTYMKLEHDQETAVIEMLLNTAMQQCDNYLNRGWLFGFVPDAVKTAVLEQTLYLYEKRGSDAPTGLNSLSKSILDGYKFFAGV